MMRYGQVAALCASLLPLPCKPACTPTSGWEKGQVENQVGNVREWLFTPKVRCADLAELNAHLAARCFERGQTLYNPWHYVAALAREVVLKGMRARFYSVVDLVNQLDAEKRGEFMSERESRMTSERVFQHNRPVPVFGAGTTKQPWVDTQANPGLPSGHRLQRVLALNRRFS